MADKKIEVFLDVTRNPPVIVDRDVSGYNKNKIEWVRGDDQDFDFKDFYCWPDGALSNPDVKDHKIKADNDPGKVGAHQYTIVVTEDDVDYQTTMEGPPTGDKPVIRN